MASRLKRRARYYWEKKCREALAKVPKRGGMINSTDYFKLLWPEEAITKPLKPSIFQDMLECTWK